MLKNLNNEIIKIDNSLILNLHEETLIKDGLKLFFSRTEFRILKCLITQLNNPVSSSQIIEYTWGESHSLINMEKVYVYIHRIRKKLESNPKKPKFLLSINGFGYILITKEKL